MSIISDIPRLIIEQGNAIAQGQAERGRIWGATLAQLGQLPGQVIEQTMQLKRQQQQEALQKLQATEMQQTIAANARTQQWQQASDNLAHNSMVTNPDGSKTFDRTRMMQGLQGFPVEIQKKWTDLFNDLDTSAANFAQARQNHNADLAHGALTAIEHGMDPETALTGAIAQGKANGSVTAQSVQPILQSIAQTGDIVGTLRQVRAQGSKDQKTVTVPEGGTVINPVTKEVIATGAPKPTTAAQLDAEYQRITGKEAAGQSLTPEEQAAKAGYEARIGLKAKTPAEKALQRESVLLDGKPAIVQVDPDPNAAVKVYSLEGQPIENAATRIKPMPPGSVVYPQIRADKLVKVEHKDPATGRTVIEWLPQSEVIGQQFEKGVSATTETRLASAQAVSQTGNDIIQKLNDPKYAATVGPAMGRYNSVREWVGNPPPELSELAGMIESYSLANMGVHGMRSAAGAEMIKKLLDAKQTPASLIAGIKGLNAFSQHFMENEGRTTPTTPAPSGGGEWVDLGGGVRVRKK